MSDELLYYGDNLPILRDHVPTACIDLILREPPFESAVPLAGAEIKMLPGATTFRNAAKVQREGETNQIGKGMRGVYRA